ncbi:MAG: L-2-hydroxyglutarate oxidase [Proteobacteria bacterium]|nr:L-2-hydroxyglutarate oxidase [Pseudomonadota bacterium]
MKTHLNVREENLDQFDIALIGGGIVGVSTALTIKTRYPKARVVLLEKENQFAAHQTGHNSGVVHAGVYYQPGSLKADFCKRGAKATMAFCKQHGLPFRQCGKLLVATSPLEMKRMEALEKRCAQNQIHTLPIDRHQLNRMEPHIFGLGALQVPATGITDYTRITAKMADLFKAAGGVVQMGHAVTRIEENNDTVAVFTDTKKLIASHLIVCGGLMADRLARMMGIAIDFMILPFRGEYYRLPDRLSKIVSHLIYPIPDPDLPFLGVHLTPMIDGCVTVGPNAVMGFKREGYGKLNVDPVDTGQMLAFPGFWKVIGRHLKSGINEWIDASYKPGYLRRIQKYCPGLTLGDMTPYPAGIRAQAVGKDGSLFHDFLFSETPRSLHVCNAPSPAATSAIPIGEHLCDRAQAKFNL